MTNTQDQREQAQNLVAWALADTSTVQVLQELGMRPQGDGSAWAGDIVLDGQRLSLNAILDWGVHWRLVGSGMNLERETILCDERMLPPMQARGRTVFAVLQMWRSLAGPTAKTPRVLYPGMIFEASRRSLEQLKVGAPSLQVDGAVLRQVVQWIRQRAEADLLQDGGVATPVALRFDQGLLRLEVDGQVYGVGARGNWAVPFSVMLADLLALPATALRGAWLRMSWAPGRIVLNRCDLPATFIESEHA
jgi:hypothetical protein